MGLSLRRLVRNRGLVPGGRFIIKNNPDSFCQGYTNFRKKYQLPTGFSKISPQTRFACETYTDGRALPIFPKKCKKRQYADFFKFFVKTG